MHDLRELGAWMAGRLSTREPFTPETLPEPTFTSDGRTLVSFSSNNYLALATSDRMKARARAAIDRYGVGNCESRLLGGNLELYEELEARLAQVKRKETSLLFATGYLANLSALPTLVKASSLARAFGFAPSKNWKHAFFTDEFNHLSIREGIRAGGVPTFAFRHRDLADLEQKLGRSDAAIKIIVTDGVFSQHGDLAPLPEMLALAERYDAALYVDDAHGTGVVGPTGGGTAEHFGIVSPRLIQMGTLSKAYGCIGGFVATDRCIAEILRIGCSAYGFTSTLPPDQAECVLEAIDMVADEPWRRAQLWANQRAFVSRLEARGLSPLAKDTPIVPVHVGDEERCECIAAGLRNAGFHVDSIVFPAIAPGQSRLRFILNAHHTTEQIDGVVDALARCTAA